MVVNSHFAQVRFDVSTGERWLRDPRNLFVLVAAMFILVRTSIPLPAFDLYFAPTRFGTVHH